MRKLFMLIAAVSLVFVGVASSENAKDKPVKAAVSAEKAQAKRVQVSSVIKQCPGIHAGIAYYKNRTWQYQLKMNRQLTVSSYKTYPSCAYAKWAAKVWRKRLHKAQEIFQRRVLPIINDWRTSVRITQRVYPGTERWLLSCSSGEGSHGAFVMNTQGSGASGWMQFMSGTFYGHVGQALYDVRSKGFFVHNNVKSIRSPLGQALTAAYMRTHGMSSHWDPSIDPLCR